MDAYCTLLLTDSYLPGAQVLAHSLRDAKTSKALACLVTLDSVSASSIAELKRLYDYVVPVERISNPNLSKLAMLDRMDLTGTFTKVTLWRQMQFRKIVYIDSDVLCLRAPDELFDIDADFAAAPDIGWPDCFNSGVMMLKPDAGTYYGLVSLAHSGVSFDGADQGLLNEYFKDYHRISFTYNVTPSGSYQYTPAYRHFESSVTMAHFIGREKPWNVGRSNRYAGTPYGELLGRWWSVWDRHYRPIYDPIGAPKLVPLGSTTFASETGMPTFSTHTPQRQRQWATEGFAYTPGSTANAPEASQPAETVSHVLSHGPGQTAPPSSISVPSPFPVFHTSDNSTPYVPVNNKQLSAGQFVGHYDPSTSHGTGQEHFQSGQPAPPTASSEIGQEHPSAQHEKHHEHSEPEATHEQSLPAVDGSSHPPPPPPPSREPEPPQRQGQAENEEPFSAPQHDWNPAHSAPPPGSAPEAANFPQETYENEWDHKRDRGFFVAPPTAPPPVAHLHYSVPSNPPEPLKQIFPWETRAQTATRVWADDTPAEEPEPETDKIEFEQEDDEDEFEEPESPMEKFGSFSRENAWDKDENITKYVNSLAIRRRSVEIIKRNPELRLSDLPSSRHDSLPSLPVTPNPVRMRGYFKGETDDAEGEFPSNPDVPLQQDWDPVAKLEQLAVQPPIVKAVAPASEEGSPVSPLTTRHLPEVEPIPKEANGGAGEIPQSGHEKDSPLKKTLREAPLTNTPAEEDAGEHTVEVDNTDTDADIDDLGDKVGLAEETPEAPSTKTPVPKVKITAPVDGSSEEQENDGIETADGEVRALST